MAYFEGNLKEIYKYLGPRTSDIVTQLARPFRKTEKGHRISCVGKNDDGTTCKKYTGLHAAHLKGKERIKMIQEILNEYGEKLSHDNYRINLETFETEFRNKHSDFNNVINFMCPMHHKQYDYRNSIIDEFDNAPIFAKEELIEKLEAEEINNESNTEDIDIKDYIKNKDFILEALEYLKSKQNFDELVAMLTDSEECNRLFKSNFPILILDKEVTENLYRRYYSNEYFLEKYKITNHWFKTQRISFEKWLKELK